MGYYTRVFCKSDKKPSIHDILNHLKTTGYDAKVDPSLAPGDLAGIEWKDFELFYHTDRLPLLVECNGLDDEDGLAKEEIEEFLDEIGEAGILAFNKKKIVRHLQATKYIVVTQLPTSDIDDNG